MVAMRNDSMLILFGRLSWMMIGPGVLLVRAVLIVSSPRAGWRTGADIVYWIALAGMILGRYVEHRGGNPRTSTGEPATAPRSSTLHDRCRDRRLSGVGHG